MILVKTEQIHLKQDDDLSSICHYAKNLYNEANYYARQRFFNYGIAPDYGDMDKVMNGRSITQNRNNRIKDQMHKISRFVVNYCIEHDIGTIVIGKNAGWKQQSFMGKRNNQNFVSIPHANLIEMITYKANEIGIDVICHEEIHTSICSFLDDEPIKQHDTYLGTRIKRGLFKTATGIFINADVNAGYNIIKKAIPKAFSNGIEGLGSIPVSVKTLVNGTKNSIKF